MHVLLTIDEAIAFATSVPFPGRVPIARPRATPPVFDRIGLEMQVDELNPVSIDVTGVVGLRPPTPAMVDGFRDTTAPGLPTLVDEAIRGRLVGRVRAIYAEFEPASCRGPQRVSVFATLDETRTIDEQRGDVEEILASLDARESSTAASESILATMSAFGPDVRAYHVGWMVGRLPVETRICFVGERCRLVAGAMRAGFDPARTDVLTELDELIGDSCTFALQVRAGRERLHSLGIELAPRPDLSLVDAEREWVALLGRLRDRRLVHPSHVESFSSWQGSHRVSTPTSRVGVRCIRTLSHVKIVADDDGTTRSKIYASVVCETTPRATGSIVSSQDSIAPIP